MKAYSLNSRERVAAAGQLRCRSLLRPDLRHHPPRRRRDARDSVVADPDPRALRANLSLAHLTSQRLLSQSKTATRVSLRIYDTHDLRTELLSIGTEVEVLAPNSLREWVHQSFTTANARCSI